MEQEIADKLREDILRTDKAPVDVEQKQQDMEEAVESGNLQGVDVGHELDVYRLYEYFDVNTQDRNTDEKLGYIYGYISNIIGSKDYLEVTRYLLYLETSMGTMARLDDRLEVIYRWAKIRKQMNDMEQARIYG